MKKEDLKLECTCEACPEQYDVIDTTRNKKVGYIRYRWATLTVNPYYTNENGELEIDFDNDIVCTLIGNGCEGVLKDSDRDEILSNCLDVLVEYYNKIGYYGKYI